jgi:hypothetical protein
VLAIVVALARRPSLWAVAVRQARRAVPPGWWRRHPFLPVPPAPYLRLRLLIQYGDDQQAPDPADVLDYLTWCRNQPPNR